MLQVAASLRAAAHRDNAAAVGGDVEATVLREEQRSLQQSATQMEAAH